MLLFCQLELKTIKFKLINELLYTNFAREF